MPELKGKGRKEEGKGVQKIWLIIQKRPFYLDKTKIKFGNDWINLKKIDSLRYWEDIGDHEKVVSLNTSSYSIFNVTKHIDRLKLEQKTIYCSVIPVERVLMLPKPPNSLKGFSKGVLKATWDRDVVSWWKFLVLESFIIAAIWCRSDYTVSVNFIFFSATLYLHLNGKVLHP